MVLLQAAGDGDDEDEREVRVEMETDHGPWVTALVASGYAVFAVNPLQAARYRDRHSVSGAKSDTGDAHILADMVRTDAHQLRGDWGRAGVLVGQPAQHLLESHRLAHMSPSVRLRPPPAAIAPHAQGGLHPPDGVKPGRQPSRSPSSRDRTTAWLREEAPSLW